MSHLKTAAITAMMAFSGPTSATSYGFGPAFSLGPVSSPSWIRSAITTLVLPEVPSPAVDRLALWPGMETSKGDLIQALAVSFSDPVSNCGGSTGQWCIWASTLEESQLEGKMVPANPGDHVTMTYVYNDKTSDYDQTVTLNEKQVSLLSTNSGKAQGWGTAVECQDDACHSSVPAHKYLSTTIVLDSADSAFGNTLSLTDATSSGFTTSDSGITWTVSTISINAKAFTGSS